MVRRYHYLLGKGLFFTGEGIRLFGISCLTPRFLFFRTPYADRAKYRSALGLKMNYFEIIFVQFLHLLAHHPDFSLTQESLPDMAKCVCLLPFTIVSSYMIFGTRYIEFYLESVASAENISLLYHLSGKAKTVRDSESHLYSEVRWTVYLRKAEAQGMSEPLCSERARSAYYQRYGEATLMDPAELPHEGQITYGYLTSFAQRGGG